MLNFALTADFEQANLFLVHIEKENFFETRLGISCFMYYYGCQQNLLTNNI